MGNVILFSSRWTSATPALLTRGVWAFLKPCGPRKHLLQPCHPALSAEQMQWRDDVAAFATELHRVYSNYDCKRVAMQLGPTDRLDARSIGQRLKAVYASHDAFEVKRLTITATERWLARSSGYALRAVRG